MQTALSRRLSAAAAVVLLWLAGTGIAAADTVTVTRAQALEIGRAAYLDGHVALSDAIARQLVSGDPQDVEALLLLSASEEALNRPDEAFYFGTKAWAAARTAERPKALRYEIARQTAHAAMSAERMRAAGRWLRRSIDVAPDHDARAQSARDLSLVVAATPLTFSGSFQVSPTDNVNNGATTGLLSVDETVIGSISGWSVARSGYVATAQLTATRNLGVTASGKARNTLSFGISGAVHWLTSAEERAEPDLEPHDLDMWSATAGWTHEIALPGHDRPLGLTAEVGQSWYAGRPYAPSLRARVSYPVPHMGSSDLALSALLERQWQDAPSGGVNGANLSVDGGMPVAALKSRLGYGVSGTFLRSDWSNTTYDSYAAYVSLTPDKSFGPVQMSVGMGGSWRHYRDYSLGFANVTKGRTDRSWWMQAGFAMPDVSVAGLSPTVTLRRGNTASNISKYETSETALHFGLAAEF